MTAYISAALAVGWAVGAYWGHTTTAFWMVIAAAVLFYLHDVAIGTSARVGVPSAERVQVEYWWRTYGADANWLLDTSASGILAIEFSDRIPPFDLFRRPGEYRAFRQTLRYGTPKKTFALFSIPPGRSMSRGWYSRLHWRTPVLIPRALAQLSCPRASNSSNR
jgi:hypothetical protein